MEKFSEIKGGDDELISVVVAKTGFDGLNQVSGTDTVFSGQQERRCNLRVEENRENMPGKLEA